MKRIIILLVIVMALAGCSDAFKADISSYGKQHFISMYSGGELVREWVSTGKVETMTDSDGWQFMDAETGKLVRIGGDVIIEVK